jgi:hypothetical protein
MAQQHKISHAAKFIRRGGTALCRVGRAAGPPLTGRSAE